MARKFLRRWLPPAEELRANRSLRWLGPLLRRPWLWQLNRRTVASGVGIGVFFGFMIPVLQILFSAMFAILLRANLPVAAVSTLISNPFTYAPIGVLAYKVGSTLLGERVDEAQAKALEADGSADTRTWLQRVGAIGKPLFAGLALFAVTGGAIGYFGVHLVWRIAIWIRLRRRRMRQRKQLDQPPEA
jgi:hypothetical protein